MLNRVRDHSFAASLALVSILGIAPQARAQSTPTTSAYVYIQIQGPAGSVYGLNAASTGKLTAIPGAPWKPAGQIAGDNKYQFFTLGDQNLYSYGLSSNGAIGSQIGSVPVLDYAGGDCGSGTSGGNGAVLDHTGSSIYILLENGSNNCAAYQTYAITKAGYFDFSGDTEITWAAGGDSGDYQFGLPSILGSETFAYSQYLDTFGPIVSGFKRESSGTLEVLSDPQWTMPANNNGAGYIPSNPDASPTGGFVVLQLYPGDGPPGQLGSFAVNSEGNLSTTNTSSNMPTLPFYVSGTTFSPSGNLFVAWADNGQGNTAQGNGIQIYNFNGAAPLTAYKTLLSGTPIDQVAWDSSNHMYAISKSENMLYVFTVTSTSVTEDTSWSIGSPFKMIVVSTGSGSGSPATQYSDPLIEQPKSGPLTTVGGQVTIDTTGNTTVTMTGQEAGQTYALHFCPAYLGGQTPPECFSITTISIDSSGSGSSTVMFPKSGDWAGEFEVSNSSGDSVAQSGLFPNISDETYLATFLPETKTNSGAVTTSKTQDPLSTGSVSYSNGTLLFNVTGATPSSSYQINETNEAALYSSDTYAIGSFTTNGSGNGNASVALATAGSDDGDMFNIEGGSGAGYIGGFSIP